MTARGPAAVWLLAAALLPLLAAAVGGSPRSNHERGPAAWEAKATQLRETVAARPDDFEAALELATTLHQLDHATPNGGKRVPEAARMYRRAADLAEARHQPQTTAFVLSNMAALLLSGGRVQEAGEVMNASLALAERLGLQRSDLYVGTLFNLAKAEQQLGHQERAQQLLVQVVERGKGVAGSSYLKAFAALKTFTPEHLQEMEECAHYLRRSRQGVDESQLSGGEQRSWRSLQYRWGWLDSLSQVDQSWISYGLFAAYEQAGQYDKAWEALHEGNQLQDADSTYNPQQEEYNTKAIMAMFQPPNSDSSSPGDAFYAALLRGAGGYRDPHIRPVFVVGMPRSGSTLIEQILASHLQVWGAGEDTALAPLLPELLGVLHTRGDVDAARIAAVGRKYVEEMRGRVPPDRAGVRWVVDKMLRNVWNIGFIAMMLGDACILHAARHPADTGLSCYAQPFEGRGTPWAANLTSIAHQTDLIQRMVDHWDVVLPGRVMHVRYCDLIRDQEGTTRRMLDHCGIPWEDSVLSFHETQRTVATASLAQVRQKLYSGSMLRFRRYARQLAPLLRPLRQLILRYEREAQLDSSQQLMAQVLDGAAAAAAGDLPADRRHLPPDQPASVAGVSTGAADTGDGVINSGNSKGSSSRGNAGSSEGSEGCGGSSSGGGGGIGPVRDEL